MPVSGDRLKLIAPLALYVAVLMLPAGFIPLPETTEARYAEIAREMIVSGDYLEPTVNGIKHFHKPPLSYWFVAAGFTLFGVNDFGARIFGIVAALLAVVFVHRIAALVLDDARKAYFAALIFASSPLLLGVSRVVSTDIYLTCFTVMAHYYLFRQVYGERRLQNALWYSFFLGLAFLVKGPIVFLFTIWPYALAKVIDRHHRSVFNLKEMAAGGALFLAVIAPWFLAVMAKNPGLADYFFQAQTVDRAVTNRFHRYQPPWFFFAIFFATFLPYVLFFIRGIFGLKRPSRAGVLLVYVAAPFIVFTLSPGKLVTYILPFYGIAAVFTAETLCTMRMERIKRLAPAVVPVLALALAVGGFVYEPLAGYKWFMVLSALLTMALSWRAYANLASDRFLLYVAVSLIVFTTTAQGGLAASEPPIVGYEKMVARFNTLDPGRRLDVMVYKGYLPSVSFYRGRLAVMAFGHSRETQFQTGDGYKRHYITAPEELTEYLINRHALFVVAKPKHLAEFIGRRSFSCARLDAQREYSSYYCTRPHESSGG